MGTNRKETVESFVRAVPDFVSLSAREQLELLVYFAVVVEGSPSVTGKQIEELRAMLNLPEGGAANTLSVGARGRERTFLKRPRGYALTRTAEERLSKRIGRPCAITTSLSVRTHLSKVAAGPLREYLAEAAGAFEARFLRAAIVMSWCAAYYVVREWLFRNRLSALNAQMSTWKKPKTVSTVDDFEDLSERTLLDTAKEASALSKVQHKTLVALLDQRNAYAHPSGRSVSEAVAEAFLQQVADEVLVKFV